MLKPEPPLLTGVGVASKSNPNTRSISIDPARRYEKTGCWLLALPETLGWYEKLVYDGHTLKRTDQGWLLMIRAHSSKKKRISFTGGQSPADAVKTAAWQLATTGLSWRDDLY